VVVKQKKKSGEGNVLCVCVDTVKTVTTFSGLPTTKNSFHPQIFYFRGFYH
jgi:hypothetical protein